MSSGALRLPYGIMGGALVYVSAVSRGLACGCICPACGGQLVAKKGKSKQHHFAHAADSGCAFGVETALHLAAKSILEKRKAIVLPVVEAKVYSARYSSVLAPEKEYEIERIEIEQRFGSLIPDVVAYIRGRPVAIEVKVSHGVNDAKRSRFRSLGVSAIEIDLSRAPRTFAPDEIEPLVIDGGPHKTWVYNAASERKRRQILQSGKVMESVHRGFAVHVDGCPLKVRVWKGRPYANVVDDCVCCEHAIDIGLNMSSVTCGA